MLEIIGFDNLVNTLKCYKCKGFLSVLPIYLTRECNHICGRCKDLIGDSFLKKDTLFETLVENLIFPCNNYSRGCTAKLKISKAVSHEKECFYQMAECPCEKRNSEETIELCTWNGYRKNLLVHIKAVHSINCQDNLVKFDLDLRESYNQSNVVCIKGETFVVDLQYDKAIKIFYCVVRGVGFETNTDTYSYTFHVINKHGYDFSFMKSMPEKWIRQRKGIDSVKDNCITMYMGHLLTTTKSTCTIAISINIDPVSKSKLDDGTEVFKHVEYVVNALEEIHCCNCNEYFNPLIYYCDELHHIVCETCKSDRCSKCNSTPIQMEAAETVDYLRLIVFPCVYSSLGCTYSGEGIDFRHHTNTCMYQIRHILETFFGVSCGEEAKISKRIHYDEEHHKFNFPYKSITTETLDLESYDNQYICVTFNEVLFLFCYKRLQHSIIFNVLNLDFNKKGSYSYQLKIIDKTERRQEFSLSRTCQVDCQNLLTAFNKDDHSISIPVSVLKEFLNPNTSKLHLECTIDHKHVVRRRIVFEEPMEF